MKFGTILPHIGPLAAGPDALDSLLSVAQKTEALGFDSLWVGDHVVIPTSIKPRYPYNDTGEFPLPAEAALLEPLTVLGFLTGVTRRVRLGPSVLVLPHRNPIVTAKMFASLDVLSRGRIIFGAGIGWMEEEISLLGAPFKRRGALSDEYLRAMRELWTNPDPHFEGEFCRFSGIKCEPKPLQKPAADLDWRALGPGHAAYRRVWRRLDCGPQEPGRVSGRHGPAAGGCGPGRPRPERH